MANAGAESGAGSEAFGFWRMVAAIIDGRDVAIAAATVMEVTPGGFSIRVNGKPYQRGIGKPVPGEDPRRAEVVVTEGPKAGMTLPQIHRIEGDVLIACQGRPGSEHPETFASEPGSGRSLSVWVRDARAADLGRRRAGGLGSVLYWLPILMVADDVEKYRVGLEPILGPRGSLAAIGLALAALELVVCLLLRRTWRFGASFGVAFAVAILIAQGLDDSIGPVLGQTGGWLVSLSTALVAGVLAWQVTSFALNVRADDTPRR